MLDLLPFANALTAAHPTDGASLWHPYPDRLRLRAEEFGRPLDVKLRPIPPRFAGIRTGPGSTRVILQDDCGEVMRLPGNFTKYVPWLADMRPDARLDWGHAGGAAFELAIVLLSVQLVDSRSVERLRLQFLRDVVAHLPDRWAIRSVDLADWALINGGPSS